MHAAAAMIAHLHAGVPRWVFLFEPTEAERAAGLRLFGDPYPVAPAVQFQINHVAGTGYAARQRCWDMPSVYADTIEELAAHVHGLGRTDTAGGPR
jgi:hypothetical protein